MEQCVVGDCQCRNLSDSHPPITSDRQPNGYSWANGRTNGISYYPTQGFTISLSENLKSDTLRVTRISPCVSAVAAMNPSMAPIGRPAVSQRATIRPQASATAGSTNKIRPSKRCGTSSWNHSWRRLRRLPTGKRSIPRRNSAKEITLIKTRSSSTSAIQVTTPGFGRSLTHSEMILVSTRNFISLYRAGGP